MDIADILSSPDFKTWYYKYRQQVPWIPCTIIILIHLTIVSFAEVSSYYLYASILADTNAMPNKSVYEESSDNF